MTFELDPDLLKRNAVIRNLADIPAEKMRKLILGGIATKIFSGRAKKLEKNSIKFSMGPFDRLLRNGLLAHALWHGDPEKQRAIFAHYWAQEADDVAHVWQNRFEKDFLGHNVVLVDALEDALRALPPDHAFGSLYEIGCGHGQVLAYLVDRFPEIGTFVGIDVSEEQTEKNRKHYTNEKMQFVGADATPWIIANASPQSIFLTNGGVFEYFLQRELEALFAHIANELSPAFVGLIETLGVDHDLEKEKNTMIYGREMAFSHNYPCLLEEAGFEIVHRSEQFGAKEHGGGRWIRVLAKIG